MSLDLASAYEQFEQSTDFTVGLEEEFAIIDPESLELVQRFEDLKATALGEERLVESIAGELISSEVEIRSGRGEDFHDALERQIGYRKALFELASAKGVRLGSLGAHPWSRWQDQHIIDTDHYRRLNNDLGYVAWRNNTFSLHVHVGIRGADRAIAVCDRMRELLPELLALSASSPWVEGRDSGLHSARTQIFTRMFPRCGVPGAWGDWQTYSRFIEFLIKTGSVVESTQLWWSVRPHHLFGTVEVRICDAQPEASDSTALEALIVACVAQAARDYDEGRHPEPLPDRYIEENFWRAIRYGLTGKLIDLRAREEYEARAVASRLLSWTEPMRGELGLEPVLWEQGASERLRTAVESAGSIKQAYGASVDQTEASYSAIATPVKPVTRA